MLIWDGVLFRALPKKAFLNNPFHLDGVYEAPPYLCRAFLQIEVVWLKTVFEDSFTFTPALDLMEN